MRSLHDNVLFKTLIPGEGGVPRAQKVCVLLEFIKTMRFRKNPGSSVLSSRDVSRGTLYKELCHTDEMNNKAILEADAAFPFH